MTAIDQTQQSAPPPAIRRPPNPVRVVHDWLRRHDPGYGALRRAVRTALIMPAMLALGTKVIGNPLIATFAAFGSFAMLLLVDFTGPIQDRIRAQALLGTACAALIALGTLASQTTWISVVGMAVVAFAVLFSAVISSVMASATTALLLAFILPVSLPGPASQVPDRIAGWAMAAGASVIAIAILWPAATRDPIRVKAIAGCRAIAERLRREVAFIVSHGSAETLPDYRAAIDAANAAVSDLYQTFLQTPYRPTGLTTSDRAVVRLVDDLRWCNTIVLRAQAGAHPHPHTPNPRVRAVKDAASDVLERCAELLSAPGASSGPLVEAVGSLHDALRRLEARATSELPSECEGCQPDAQPMRNKVVSALDPSFRAQELSFVVLQIAANTNVAAAAARRGWVARVLGRQPKGFTGLLSSAGERARTHLDPSSIWLHNSLRGAAALALAVLVADIVNVQHGFWVAFGALSVLRSNALATGQNTLRAVIGTAVGFGVGGALVYAIGSDTTVLWIVLPFVVLFGGIAPAAISFVAGQAAFTMVLLFLFNIIAPVGWKIGLVRIEDVVIGGAVSLAVGLLFWPHGAGRSLGRALARAYEQCVAYLAAAVEFGVGRCDPLGPTHSEPPRQAALAAAAASRRLDDTFRSYLADRGVKQVPLADVTRLVTGVTGVRLAADAVLALWESDTAHDGERGAARRELLAGSARIADWYGRLATGLEHRGEVPEPQERDLQATQRLVDAVAHDLQGADGAGTATGVRVVWTGDHLDAVRRLEQTLVASAHVAVTHEVPAEPAEPAAAASTA
ncbi:MAG TPA: FUSC family protein [Solirubrobacteraceae bacterium]|nr:FUSC family protein [Solirubrobacteraceae bacterium]